MPTVTGAAALPAAPVLVASAALTIKAGALLAAQATLTCSVIYQRITITPSTVHFDGSGVHGPLTDDSYVLVPGLNDGIYDT